MRHNILNLIKSSATNEKDYKALEDIFTLYDQLQFASDIKQMAGDIYNWLNATFKIDNVSIALFDIEKSTREDILIHGDQFYLDDSLSFFFIINTHTNLNAIVSFCATSKTHFELINKSYNVIESAFFQISPIIQNGIIKKNFIESQSLDSVTNVYNRHYLIENLNKQIILSGKEYKQIYFLMVGVDHFKAVIDEYDYDIGDRVLVELAKVIHANISEFDMVARLTGDEFLISILSTSSEHDIINISNKIIKDFAEIEIKITEEQILKKTICIGYDVYNYSDEKTIDSTIKNADIALYEAKNKGRSQVFNFNDMKEEDTIDLF
ncbi:GGDEF domain-containing protein [Malaciobacter halophilus]|uniref:diguanylate cyclase n=1 Tax=Malaciobacter halophilus TaxID=197482 RepID=A0A2N1IZR3_9BACT|nr:GGDEF domain-containing protein [Malaciobacter halophilus]AXH09664.1 diguanylate cyclase [Malaciobacter halophilus]PKI79793.1 GGDEF domain-containing protein [Malaciobacter halophilus]